MLFVYLFCSKKQKPKLRRENTPYPKQTIIDLDEETIEITSKFNEVVYEYLPGTGVLRGYKKE
jgi:hypothetical protein